MKSAYIFHDAFSDPVSEWYAWMKTALEEMGYFVVVPKFPTPAGQSLDSWMAVANAYASKWDEGTIVIGHGAGGAFALRMVEKAAVSIHGLFLVASYAEKIGHAGFDRVNESFFKNPFDWSAIKSHAMVIESFAGGNDPFVPASVSENLAANLGIKSQIIPDGGHVTRADGFTQCVPVLSGIKESMSAIEKTITPEMEVPVASPSPAKGRAGVGFEDSEQNPLPASLTSGGGAEPTTTARTMYQDMSTLVNSNSGSVASSLLNKAREDEAAKESVSPGSTKNLFYIVGAAIAVAVALGIIGYVLYKNSPAGTLPVAAPINSLVLADSHLTIGLDNKTSYALASAIRTALAKPLADASILDIVYAGTGGRAPIKTVLSALGISAPESFGDQLTDPAWMHAAASFNGTTSHFLAIPIGHYDTAFSGLHDWEPTMVRDLGIFFGLPDAYIKTTSGTGSFTNAIVENHPVRALYYHAKAKVTLDEPVAATSAPVAAQTSSFTAVSYKDYLKNLKGEAMPSSHTQGGGTVALATETSQAPDINFIAPATTPNIPNALINVPVPYKEGDLMLAYFFINEHTLIVTDSTAIIPQILERYANSQIYTAK
ncbi:MAG: hypothetical protein JWM20_307 [Patescibacteria group bacterium]|nr:hypothetical protein [Patescibacteria group bacterium]